MRLLLLIIPVITSLLLGGSVSIAHADTLSVTPPKFELFGAPGDTINEKLKVRNDNLAAVTYTSDAADFTASDDAGGVNIIDDPAAKRTTYSLASWVTISPKKFTVQSAGEQIVNISIKIPKDGEPGGHYATVQINFAGSAVAGGGASVVTKLDSLILLRVAGNLKENLAVDTFNTSDNYYKNGPIDFNLRAKNSGNVHVAPTGTIIINDTFGHKVKELDLASANVLPGAARVLTTTWSDTNMIGHYTATMVATYGQSKQALTATTSFYVIPSWLLYLVGVTVFVLFLLITQRKAVRRAIHNLTS